MAAELNSRKQVGKRIRLLRAASNLSQAELAEKIGVSFQQIQKYESGKNEISVSRLLSIADALGVSPEDVIGVYPSAVRDKGRSRRSGVVDYNGIRDEDEKITVAVSPDELKLLSSFRKIKDKTVRRIIMDLIISIALYGSKM